MISFEEVEELLRQELRGKVKPDVEIRRDTVLKDLGLSSLQLADIVFTIEERHDIEFGAKKAADVATVGQMLDVANEAVRAAA